MANFSEDIQSAGSDTRPPMLDSFEFASWQQRIRLYCQGNDNGENILKSIDEGTFKIGKLRETLAEGAECALHLGLPKYIYILINHCTDAKDIWDNVKMLLEGEKIHNYYVSSTKLINDMRNIKMTMSKMQLNSKFVNNMLPEWGRFVTIVKLNKGLNESNYDQLYAYLKQHKAYANKNKMILYYYNQHVIDPIALENNARGAVAAGNEVFITELAMQIMVKQDNAFDDDVDEPPIQDLALNVDNIFQAGQCDAFDSNVDEAPTAQTIFKNDHFGAIMGYGDYVIGDILEVAFRKHSCYVRNEDGVDLLKGSRGSNLSLSLLKIE
ncbi:hypothetical protein Tco_0723640 [Tanacetum coccineum]